MHTDDVRRSKRLSYLLRHHPEAAGLTLDAAGWVAVTELLTATGLTREELARVVETNDKQRFEWDLAGDRIRARQGHSVDVELDLPVVEPPAVLYHGTPRRNLGSILAGGLDRRQRHHVHLSADAETAARVGARRGDHVVLAVAAGAMHAAGHEFRVTGNGVWLVDAVPPEFLGQAETGTTRLAL